MMSSLASTFDMFCYRGYACPDIKREIHLLQPEASSTSLKRWGHKNFVRSLFGSYNTSGLLNGSTTHTSPHNSLSDMLLIFQVSFLHN